MMVNDAVAPSDLLSVTCTVNEEVAGIVGVPEIWPLVFKVKPPGRLPEAIDHV